MSTEREQIIAGLVRIGFSADTAVAFLQNNPEQARRYRLVPPPPREEKKEETPIYPDLPTTPADFTFGVEIECLVKESEYRNASSDVIRRRTRSASNKTFFKDVGDGSIKSDIKGYKGREVVSPILKGDKGFEKLKEVCDILKACNTRVNDTCGLHIHVGVKHGISDNLAEKVHTMYRKCESVIDTFMSPSRRGKQNEYCQSIIHTRCDLGKGDRYKKLNLVSLRKHGTIEFRHHQGTSDYEEICNWIKFCVSMVDYCNNHTRDELRYIKIKSIDKIPFISNDVMMYYKQKQQQYNTDNAM